METHINQEPAASPTLLSTLGRAAATAKFITILVDVSSIAEDILVIRCRAYWRLAIDSIKPGHRFVARLRCVALRER
jgi:hypothetical protein